MIAPYQRGKCEAGYSEFSWRSDSLPRRPSYGKLSTFHQNAGVLDIVALEDIIQGIPKPNWLDAIDLVQKSGSYELTREERDRACSQLAKWFKVGNAKHATNWLMIGLVFGRTEFIDHMRHTGVLRPSKYDYSARTIRSALSRLLSSRLELGESVERYLTSMKNLCILSDAVGMRLQSILRPMSRYRGMILRQLLAHVDLVFMRQATQGFCADREAKGDQLIFYSPEDLAEALSFIIYLYRSRLGTPTMTHGSEEADDSVCWNLLVMGAQIRNFQKYEILVDSFDYCLQFDSQQRCATLSAPTIELETAIRLGFIGVEMQKQLSSIRAPSEDIVSLRKMGEDFYGLVKDKFVELKEDPFKRYTFRVFTEGPLKELLDSDSIFAEEHQILEYASTEWLAPLDQLLQFKVSGQLTVWDVMKTQRMFNFVRWYMTTHLEPKLGEETELVIRSLVPSFVKEDILRILMTVIGDKADAMLDFLSWHPDRSGMLDLQYQPIVEFEQTVLVPINVLANSDLLRNSLKLSGKRLYSDGTVDPLVNLLEHVLRTRTAQTVRNMQWSWNSAHGEVDVMALIDGILFVFECKNSLLPGNIFELRTSYDYIITASSQLDAFCQALSSEEFRNTISDRIGWRIGHNDRVVTCIVMMNRMFTGYRVGAHAVRGAFEILRQIESGTIALGQEEKCLWQGNEFTGEDLRRFIEDDSLHSLLWKSMVKTREVMPIGQFEVSYETLCLDLKLLSYNAGFSETSRMLEQQPEPDLKSYQDV